MMQGLPKKDIWWYIFDIWAKLSRRKKIKKGRGQKVCTGKYTKKTNLKPLLCIIPLEHWEISHPQNGMPGLNSREKPQKGEKISDYGGGGVVKGWVYNRRLYRTYIVDQAKLVCDEQPKTVQYFVNWWVMTNCKQDKITWSGRATHQELLFICWIQTRY